ncbi:MAG TPA: hypothetical protein VGY31_05100 [Terriglobia bacterium]|nr:hypothetical protein [Terriglobia bacterium]
MTDKPRKLEETEVLSARVPKSLKRTVEGAAHLSGRTAADVVIVALKAYFDSLPKGQREVIAAASKQAGTLQLPLTLNTSK